jgi:methyltransferase (TIGR00027 family)
MEEGRPSSTAQRAAMLRAAHQILDQPRVLDDPLALRIIGAAAEAALRANLERVQTAPLRALRASIALRSRYAEDRLAEAVRRGVRQYVILGAGLDTFAYRNPFAASALRVFEIDHPATQADKRARLAEMGVEIPGSLTFVPIDFERETLADGLTRMDFSGDQPTFFSWLGVTMYLSRDAVMQTLQFVASAMPAGSEIVFSYVVETSVVADRAAALGEPFRTFFEPTRLANDLRELGFRQIDDIGPEEANRRYFADRTDRLRVGGSGHLLAARV